MVEEDLQEDLNWRDASKPKFISDPELRKGVTVEFISDDPEELPSKFGEGQVSFIFPVMDGPIERRLRAPKGLRKTLMLYENLKGVKLYIKRSGEGFKTAYEVKDVSPKQDEDSK